MKKNATIQPYLVYQTWNRAPELSCKTQDHAECAVG